MNGAFVDHRSTKAPFMASLRASSGQAPAGLPDQASCDVNGRIVMV